MKKWKIEIIIVLLVILAGLFVWWFIDTIPERAENAEYKNLVRFSDRQAIEIKIIKQAVELQQLKAKFQPAPAPPLPAPVENE